MTDLRTSEATTGTGDRSRPRAALPTLHALRALPPLPALCATRVTGWGIAHYAFLPVLDARITAGAGAG
ncbi:hypothetical protein [Streptomyces sp. NPDC058741]|uniref:hypothetical protein n=1 Tax=unclassified Streptomyces TaxID=2593676 RepID=UPI003690ED0B